jgi:hypothetical protein
VLGMAFTGYRFNEYKNIYNFLKIFLILLLHLPIGKLPFVQALTA